MGEDSEKLIGIFPVWRPFHFNSLCREISNELILDEALLNMDVVVESLDEFDIHEDLLEDPEGQF